MKLLKNKVFYYTSSRYATYAIQFLNSLLIAKYLGVYYLGIWGFITLILQYLMRLNFGISNATNAIASIHKSNEKYVSQIVGVSITLLLLLTLIILLFFFGANYFSLNIGAKYSFVKYTPYVIVIAILNNFNLFFSNIFRVYSKLIAIAINQSIVPIVLLIVIFLYQGEDLLWALIIANLIAVCLAFSFFIFTSPISIKPKINWKLAKKIQVKATYLFIYNACFYLIIISTRTFVSEYYSVEEFGFFTFAFSLANSVLLLFESMSFLIFPKLLNRFSNKSINSAVKLLNLLRNSYITISHFSIHIVIILYPFLITFFNEYQSTGKTFTIIALTVVIYSNSFGYQGLIIAKEKEKVISFIAFIALILNITLSYTFVKHLNFSYEFVMFSTMLTYFIYIFHITKYGRKLLSLKTDFSSTFLDVFPVKWMLPFCTSIIITFYFYNFKWLYILPILIFVLLNFKSLIKTYEIGKKIIYNPNIIDI